LQRIIRIFSYIIWKESTRGKEPDTREGKKKTPPMQSMDAEEREMHMKKDGKKKPESDILGWFFS